MLDFLTLQPEVFGLDIDDNALRIVKLKKKRKGFVITSFNEISMPPGILKDGVIQDERQLADAIKKACSTVKGKSLGTKHVVVSLPERKSFFQVIQMPRMTEQELTSAVPIEAESYIPLPMEKVYVDFQAISSEAGLPAQAGQSHIPVLINGMPKAIVDSYVSCIKSAGLIPCVMEVESQAVARALMPQGKDSPLVIVADIGRSETIFIILSGQSVQFTSSAIISSQQFTDAIMGKLNVSGEKAEKLKIKYGLGLKGEKKYRMTSAIGPMLSELATQIKKYMDFYRGHMAVEGKEQEIHKVVLCGGGGMLKGLPEFLAKDIKIPVEMGDPFANIIQQRSSLIPRERSLAFTTAIGLAIRGATNEL